MASKLIHGLNDLATKYPEIASQWDWDKNYPTTPADVLPNTNIKYWWICERGHSYDANPNNRVSGKNCPFCSGRRVLTGENDLLTRNPKLAEEWDYSRNYPLRPEHVMPGRNKMAYWICKKCGHEWKAVINSRNRGAGCPKCAKRFHSSFPEQVLFYYLQQAYPDTINSYKDIFKNGMELDIYIPSIRTGIEYDGERAHSEKRLEKDYRKYQVCQQNNIKLIRIREILYAGELLICDLQIKSDYASGNLKALDDLIAELEKILSFSVDYDVDRDQIIILEHIKSALNHRSLAAEYPSIAQEWNFERNGNLTPEMFFSGNGDRVWWRCARGHEWRAAIQPRTKNGVGCPYCSNKRVLVGFNDLKTTDPDIANEWNIEKNGALTPEHVTRSNGKRVWWRCSSGHEYPMKIYHRTAGHKCPFCSGSKALSGENDFATTYPMLLAEWDYTKNEAISPYSYLPGSEKKVWWLCKKCGHSWEAIIANRVKGSGCPECGKKLANKHALQSKIAKGDNLEKWCHEHPDKEYLLDEWDSENEQRPSEVSPKSYTKILWRCSVCGYRWRSEVFRRANHEKTCPVCLNRVAMQGVNDFASRCPDLVKEWCYELNGTLKPEEVPVGSSKVVWWQGVCGHRWEAKVSDRGSKHYGCPYCSGTRVLAGFNDLASQSQLLVSEWLAEKNELKPEEVNANSHRKAWWKCRKCGHIWYAQIKSRFNGSGCPECSGTKKQCVRNIDTGEVFESLSDAAKHYCGKPSPISNCCKGKQNLAYGYRWEFVL